jgi:hypothetical protein
MNLPSQDDLQNVAKRVWQPALAGAIGGGGLAGYLSSRDGEEGETPGNRRLRILRNALAGAGMGAAGAGALEEGGRVALGPFFGDTDKKPALVDRGIGALGSAGLRHGLALGVGAGGAGAIWKSVKSHQRMAQQLMFNKLRNGKGHVPLIPKTETEDEVVANSPEALVDMLYSRPQLKSKILHHLKKETDEAVRNPDMWHKQGPIYQILGGQFHAKDILNEAGFNEEGAPSRMELFKRILGLSKSEIDPTRASLGKFLKGQGPISKQIGKLISVKPIATGIGEHSFNPAEIPEFYRRFVRPSIGKFRIPPIAQVGLLGAGMYGADRVQKRLMGQ